MIARWYLGGFVAVALAACGGSNSNGSGSGGEGGAGGAGSGGGSAPLPSTVTIQVVSARISPFERDGSEWDGIGNVGQDIVDGLLDAIGSSDPVSSVLAYLAKEAVKVATADWDAPDPEGSATLYVGGLAERRKLPAMQDTTTPNWGANWTGVPFGSTLRLKIALDDQDLVENDPIGTAEINYNDMLEALRSGKVLQVNVASQTNRQLLFVGIVVIPE